MEGCFVAKSKNRYKIIDKYMTYALIADGAIFVLYLLFAGFGVLWGKVLFAILGILVSGLCLGYLYLTQELLRKRSLWMSAGAAAVIICILVSLITNIPSPKTVYQPTETKDAAVHNVDA
jgi:hypothetical protein